MSQRKGRWKEMNHLWLEEPENADTNSRPRVDQLRARLESSSCRSSALLDFDLCAGTRMWAALNLLSGGEPSFLLLSGWEDDDRAKPGAW